MSLDMGCPKGRRFRTQLAAQKAADRGAEGKPGDEECKTCGWWHLHVPEQELGFSDEVRLFARIRSGHGDATKAACEACGKRLGRLGGDIQHRVARGLGGCKDMLVNGLGQRGRAVPGLPPESRVPRTWHGR